MINQPIMPPALLLDTDTAARSLSISVRKLQQLTADGAIKCVRIGRSVRYAQTDLTTYVESLRAVGGSK